ncbi:hypothetical protein JMK10_20440 [Rhodovulum sulfidophilum]|uniref:hypothetical protein n=1 Tax=Rhodovulum sulfidophilum TaxID=35806 RepID=UPI001920E8D1|nr:hypothetical protein [Rhodovulum sulfidophilum]MBL3576283.1 hypothetical protein [Rhodovulum sulfidophilum]MCF4119062.1 hypothetical protein [Rhodovulum sulfidophilum]
MKIFAKFVSFSLLLFFVAACKAESVTQNFKYNLKTEEGWPVVAFIQSPSFGPIFADYEEKAWVQNGGYTDADASLPVRNILNSARDTTHVHFKITWYEVVTEKVYSSSLDVDMRDLKLDPITSDFGILIFRISADGMVQAVTYDEIYPSSDKPRVAIELTESCGKQDIISDEKKKSNMQFMLRNSEVKGWFSHRLSEMDIPKHCN